jgi:hypothetical protein
MVRRSLAIAIAVSALVVVSSSAASAATSPYVGAWHASFSGARWTFTLAPSGVYTILHNGLLQTRGTGQFVASSLSMVHETGPWACGPTKTGGYGMSIDGTKLRFTRIFDSCPRRKTILVGHDFTRGP